jgi:hypothetical protein
MGGYLVYGSYMAPTGIGGAAAEAVEQVINVGSHILESGVTAEGVGMATLGLFFTVTPGDELLEGRRLFRVAKYRDLPRPRNGMHGHHGVMSKWMEVNFPNYNANLAPAVGMPAPNHWATARVYNKWRAQMERRMGGHFRWEKISETQMKGLSRKMFRAAEVPADVQREYWRQYRRMKQALRK